MIPTTGTADKVEFKFSQETLDFIEIELKVEFKTDISDYPDFIPAIEDEISFYKSFIESNSKSTTSPKLIRNNLRNTKNLLSTLVENLRQLDDFSKYLIHRYIGTISVDGYLEESEIILGRFESALDDAERKLPKAGRLGNFDRHLLAIKIADAIEEHLNKRPTGTKEGLFHSLLQIILQDCSDGSTKNLHHLAEKVIKYRNQKMIDQI